MNCEVVKVISYKPIRVQQFPGLIPAGFPSPAADYAEETIDLEAYLRPNPTSTFVVKCTGDSMIDSNILPGSLLIIDRSLPLKNNCVVLAVVSGDLVLKHYVKDKGRIKLVPANKKYHPILITEDMDFSIWGVVTKVILDL